MPTSSDYLSVCSECRAWCCKGVKPPVTKQERHKILQAGFPDHFVKFDNDLYLFDVGDSQPCPYLKKDYSCGIQDVKPLLCKAWPVIPRIKQGKRSFLLIQCPLFPLLSKEDIERANKEAAKISSRVIALLWTLSREKREQYKRFPYKEL